MNSCAKATSRDEFLHQSDVLGNTPATGETGGEKDLLLPSVFAGGREAVLAGGPWQQHHWQNLHVMLARPPLAPSSGCSGGVSSSGFATTTTPPRSAPTAGSPPGSQERSGGQDCATETQEFFLPRSAPEEDNYSSPEEYNFSQMHSVNNITSEQKNCSAASSRRPSLRNCSPASRASSDTNRSVVTAPAGTMSTPVALQRRSALSNCLDDVGPPCPGFPSRRQGGPTSSRQLDSAVPFCGQQVAEGAGFFLSDRGSSSSSTMVCSGVQQQQGPGERCATTTPENGEEKHGGGSADGEEKHAGVVRGEHVDHDEAGAGGNDCCSTSENFGSSSFFYAPHDLQLDLYVSAYNSILLQQIRATLNNASFFKGHDELLRRLRGVNAMILEQDSRRADRLGGDTAVRHCRAPEYLARQAML